MYISIGLPVYNAAPYLDLCIRSIINQTFIRWELIIIDDGSTDDTLLIAKSFSDPRIRVYSDGLNKKLPSRLNEIVDLAKYSLICRMDADDLIPADRLQVQYDTLLSLPNVDIVSTGVVSFSGNKVIGTRFTQSNYKPTLVDVIKGKSGIVHASIMGRKDWFLRNRYDEGCIQAEDYKLWLSAFISNDLNVFFVEELLYYYREDQNVTLKKMLKGYLTQIEIIKSFSCLNVFIRSFFVFKLLLKIIYVTVVVNIVGTSYLLKRRSSPSRNQEFQEKFDKLLLILNDVN